MAASPSELRRAGDALLAPEPPRLACRTMVGLLALAHDRECEAELAAALDSALLANELQLTHLTTLRERFAPATGSHQPLAWCYRR